MTALLDDSDVFVLPTLGENFGHAICEAMRRGVVPIISSATPFSMPLRGVEPRLLAERPDDIGAAIDFLADLGEERFADLRKRVISLSVNTQGATEAYLSLFDP